MGIKTTDINKEMCFKNATNLCIFHFLTNSVNYQQFNPLADIWIHGRQLWWSCPPADLQVRWRLLWPADSQLQTFKQPQRDLQAPVNCICRDCNGEKPAAAAASSPSSCDSAGRIYLCPFRFAGEMQPRPIVSRLRRLSAALIFSLSLSWCIQGTWEIRKL